MKRPARYGRCGMNSQFDGADFLDSLLLRFQITLKDIAECDRVYHDEIESMERIFFLETAEDARRLFAVPRLLDPLAADEIIACLREEERNNPAADTAEGDFKQYKTLLAAAFVFNPVFFAAAWNWCAAIREDLQKQLLARERRPSPQDRPAQTRRPFEIVVFGKRHFHSGTSPVIEYRAASGADAEWREFGEYRAPRLGLIHVHCLNTGTFRYVKFVFSPEIPAPRDLRQPYCIRIEFRTRDAVHTLSALDEWGGSGSVESEQGENIDYS